MLWNYALCFVGYVSTVNKIVFEVSWIKGFCMLRNLRINESLVFQHSCDEMSRKSRTKKTFSDQHFFILEEKMCQYNEMILYLFRLFSNILHRVSHRNCVSSGGRVGFAIRLGGGSLCDRLMNSAEKGERRWSRFRMEGRKQDKGGYC